MNEAILDGLLAKALAQEILRHIDVVKSETLIERVDCNLIALLDEIKTILDDPDLNDAECFFRIDAIVDAFHEAGLFTRRHCEVD